MCLFFFDKYRVCFMVMIMVMMIIGLVDDDNACTKDWSCRLQRETIRYSNDEPLRKKLDEICEKICFGKTIFVCDTKCFTYDYDAYDGLIIYIMTSTSLYYISLSLGFGSKDDRHRHPNINIREIIWQFCSTWLPYISSSSFCTWLTVWEEL